MCAVWNDLLYLNVINYKLTLKPISAQSVINIPILIYTFFIQHDSYFSSNSSYFLSAEINVFISAHSATFWLNHDRISKPRVIRSHITDALKLLLHAAVYLSKFPGFSLVFPKMHLKMSQ